MAELGWTMQRKPFSVQTQTHEKRGDLLLWMARQQRQRQRQRQRQQLLFLLLQQRQQRVCRQARVLPPLTRTRLETSTTCLKRLSYP